MHYSRIPSRRRRKDELEAVVRIIIQSDVRLSNLVSAEQEVATCMGHIYL